MGAEVGGGGWIKGSGKAKHIRIIWDVFSKIYMPGSCPRPMELSYPGTGTRHVWMNKPSWEIQLEPLAKIH